MSLSNPEARLRGGGVDTRVKPEYDGFHWDGGGAQGRN